MEFLRNSLYRLLRASEHYTRTDMIYLTKGGFWLTLNQIVAIAIGLIVSIALANLISPQTFGTYKFVLSLVGLVGALSLTGIPPALVRSVARGYENALRSGFLASLRWSAGAVIAAFAIAVYYYLNDNKILAASMLIAGSLFPLMHAAPLYNSYLNGKKEFRRKSLCNIGQLLAAAIVLVSTLLLTDNPILIVTAYFGGTVLASLFLYYQTQRRIPHDAKHDPTLVPYSLHLSAMGIIGIVGTHIDKVLVFHFLGAVPLALYAFAIAPIEQLGSGNKILKALVLPKLSTRPFEELREALPRKSLAIFIIVALLVLLYVFLAPFLYQLFFPQYTEAVTFSQWYALTLLFIPATLLAQTLTAHQKTKELYITNTATPIIKIVSFAILLPLYGLGGLIAAHILTRLFNALLLMTFFRRKV